MEPNENKLHSLTDDPEKNRFTVPPTEDVIISSRTGKPKRRKALRACTNCQRTHLTCDNNRPCERCVKRGCADTCVDGVRKAPKSFRQTKSFKKATSISTHSNEATQATSSDKPHSSRDHYHLPASHEVYEQKYHTQPPVPIQSVSYEQGAVETLYDYSGSNPRYESGYAGDIYYQHQLYEEQPDQFVKPIPGSYEHGVYYHENAYSDMARASRPFSSDRDDEISSGHYGSEVASEMDTAYASSAYQQAYPSSYQDFGQHGVSPGNREYIHMANKPYQHSTYQNSYSSAREPSQPSGSKTNSQHSQRYTDETIRDSSDDNQSIISSMLHDSRKSSLASTKLVDSSKEHRSDTVSTTYRSGVGVASKQSTTAEASYGLNEVTSNKDLGGNEPDWLDIQLNPFTSIHDEKSERFNFDSIPTRNDGTTQGTIRPFPYLESLRAHFNLLRRRLSPREMDAAKEIVSRLMSIGLRVTRIMSLEDQIFVEQCFQRSFQEKQQQFPQAPTACMIWRRTGDIVAVSPSFCRLTGWTAQQLVSEFVTVIMDNEGIINYLKCLEMIYTSQDHNFRFLCQLSTREKQLISTEVEISVQKDLYNLPLIIFGKFWTY